MPEFVKIFMGSLKKEGRKRKTAWFIKKFFIAASCYSFLLLTVLNPAKASATDTTKPVGTVTINSGSSFTNSTAVTITLTCDDGAGSGCAEALLSNDNTNWSSPITFPNISVSENFTATSEWIISSGGGEKTVYAKIKDNSGNWSDVYNDTIILDSTEQSTTLLATDVLMSPDDYDMVLDNNGKAHVVYEKYYMNNVGGTWQSPEDTGLGVSDYVTIDLDSSGKVHFLTNDDYKNNVSGTWSWDQNVISGGYHSMAIDSADKLHVAYKSGVDGLNEAVLSGGSWSNYNIDSGEDYLPGRDPDIAIDSLDKSHIVYSNLIPKVVKYATNAFGSWTTEQISDSVRSDQAIAVDSSDYPHIAYRKEGDAPDWGNIYYRYKTASGWNEEQITSGWTSSDIVDIGLDGSGVPFILYTEWAYPSPDNLIIAEKSTGSWNHHLLYSADNFWGGVLKQRNGSSHVLIFDRSSLELIYMVKYFSSSVDATDPSTTASPAGGTYASAQSVTLTADETATIYYTTDGTTPTTSSTVYSGAVNISSMTTLKYFARDTVGNEEAVNTEVYTIGTPPTGSITINSGDSFTGNPAVTLSLTCSDNESGCADMQFSNYSGSDWSGWTSYGSNYAWTLTDGNSVKTVYVKFRDGGGNVSSIYSDTISLDIYAPDTFTDYSTASAYADIDGDGLTDFEEYRLNTDIDQDNGDTSYLADNDSNYLPDALEVSFFNNSSVSPLADADGDGMSNIREYFHATDPNTDNSTLTDTDSDGVPDIVEMANGTDPDVSDATADPDGDGLTNYEEYLLGSGAMADNRLMTDTDNDSIPDMIEIAAGLDPGNSDGGSEYVDYMNGIVGRSGLADSDGDGMPDLWEVANGLDPAVDNSSTDTDGDGINDPTEYAMGLSPVDANQPPVKTTLVTGDASEFAIGNSVRIDFNATIDPEGMPLTYYATLYEGLDTSGIALETDIIVDPASGYEPSAALSVDTVYTVVIRASDGYADSSVTVCRFAYSDGSLTGDLEYNGQVDGYDLILLSVVFGKDSSDPDFNPFADLNDDGVIDGLDLAMLSPYFGQYRP